jgi:hypothetical protein
MTFWEYLAAIAIIGFTALLIFCGVFEWIAHREQDEPKDMNHREYYDANPDEQPPRRD